MATYRVWFILCRGCEIIRIANSRFFGEYLGRQDFHLLSWIGHKSLRTCERSRQTQTITGCVKFLVHAKENAFFKRVRTDVVSFCPIDKFALRFGQSFTLQQIPAPGRQHHLNSENVGSCEIFVQMPVERPIPQVNNANLPNQSDQFTSPLRVDLELIGDQHWTILRPRQLEKFMRESCHLRRLQILCAGEVNRKTDRKGQAY
jgi:hypothetical protein